MEVQKPEHVTDEIWQQHLSWMKVMGIQVTENRKAKRAEPRPRTDTKRNAR